MFVPDYQYLLDFAVCSTGVDLPFGVLRDAESNIQKQHLRATSKSNISPSLRFLRFFALLAIPIKVYAAEIYGGVAYCAIT